MNVEKHECSLLEVFSDVGSTPTASTISHFHYANFPLQGQINSPVVPPCFAGVFGIFGVQMVVKTW
jgi:hypothetical protein